MEMMMMIHFVFTIVKISFQAGLYALLALVLFRKVAEHRPEGWVDRISKNKMAFWFKGGSLIWVALFCFLFTYWGFHGFGDGPRVPIGHRMFVDNTNWTEHGYMHGLQTSDGYDLMTTEFLAVEDKLLGNFDSWFDRYRNAYFVYDMDDRELIEFSTRNEFDAYALSNALPSSRSLRTFKENYDDRWGGLWFLLLP